MAKSFDQMGHGRMSQEVLWFDVGDEFTAKQSVLNASLKAH
jgi:hypothetical protein